jgi:hypothetical protein
VLLHLFLLSLLPFQQQASCPHPVTIPVSVQDGVRFISDPDASSFEIREGKKVYRPIHVQLKTEEPIYYAVLIEYSRALPTDPDEAGFFRFPWQDVMYEAAKFVLALTRQVRPQDRIALATFDVRLRVLTGFTQDRSVVLKGVEDLFNSAGPIWGESATFDVVRESLWQFEETAAGKRVVLIVVGTGQNTLAAVNQDDLLAVVRQSPFYLFFVRIGWQATLRLEQIEESTTHLLVDRRSFLLNQAALQFSAIARASGADGFELRFVRQAEDFAETIALWSEMRHEVTYCTSEPDKSLKLKVTYLRAIPGPDGKPFKLKAITRDRRVPISPPGS